MDKKILLISLFTLQINIGCSPDIVHKSDNRNIDTIAECPFEVNAKKWFLYPPPGTVTGFPVHKISALQDAKIRFAGYRRMFVKGKLNSYHDEKYYNKLDSISFFFDSNDTASLLNPRILDSMFICCPNQVYLILTDSLLNQNIDTSSHSPCEPPEALLHDNYQDSVNLFGKGTSTLIYYNQSLSWMNAEESAIKNLCRQSFIRISSIVKKSSMNDVSEISSTASIEMDIEVKNIHVIARYYDNKSNNCIVWVSCKKSDIKHWKEGSN